MMIDDRRRAVVEHCRRHDAEGVDRILTKAQRDAEERADFEMRMATRMVGGSHQPQIRMFTYER